ncbi:hypothetical protein [Streptomyces cadmiisoli]|uniref:hypothetical protein n=1 Tax=Streptomyces cadmiisoli TaxID=2184053 RepID=UPI003658A9F7
MPAETDPIRTAMTDGEAAVEARRIITEFATNYRDPSPVPSHGTTPPVPQPDSRRVPAWATGIAVASLGIGAGATGIGCAAWLVLKGLSMATMTSVLLVAAPFAGVAVAAIAVGALIARVKNAVVPEQHDHHYNGPVDQRHVHTENRGVWARTDNRG